MFNKKILIIALGLMSMNAMAQVYSGTIYRYVGKDGKMYYTDTVPPSIKGKVEALSGKSGVLQRVIEKEMTADEYAANQKLQEKDKTNAEKESDRLKNDQRLLNTYSSPKEIDAMKKYELEQIDNAIQTDTNNINMLTQRKLFIEAEIKRLPGKDGQSYNDELKVVIANLANSNKSLERNKEMSQQREKKYDEEKKRYLEIIQELSKKANPEQK